MSAEVINLAEARAKREARRKRREHFAGIARSPWWLLLLAAAAAYGYYYITDKETRARIAQ